MLVLGVVRTFQPVHGYDVRRELVSWHVEEWASLAPASIYSALKTLTKDGLVEPTGTDQVGGRPERTLYRITHAGEHALIELVRKTLWVWAMPVDPLVSAISMMRFLKRDELIAGLEARAAHIQGGALHSEYAINAIDDVETPAHVREMLRLINARVTAELPWSKAFIDRLKRGEYRTADDPPWRPAQLKTDAGKPSKSAAKKPAPRHRKTRR